MKGTNKFEGNESYSSGGAISLSSSIYDTPQRLASNVSSNLNLKKVHVDEDEIGLLKLDGDILFKENNASYLGGAIYISGSNLEIGGNVNFIENKSKKGSTMAVNIENFNNEDMKTYIATDNSANILFDGNIVEEADMDDYKVNDILIGAYVSGNLKNITFNNADNNSEYSNIGINLENENYEMVSRMKEISRDELLEDMLNSNLEISNIYANNINNFIDFYNINNFNTINSSIKVKDSVFQSSNSYSLVKFSNNQHLINNLDYESVRGENLEEFNAILSVSGSYFEGDNISINNSDGYSILLDFFNNTVNSKKMDFDRTAGIIGHNTLDIKGVKIINNIILNNIIIADNIEYKNKSIEIDDLEEYKGKNILLKLEEQFELNGKKSIEYTFNSNMFENFTNEIDSILSKYDREEELIIDELLELEEKFHIYNIDISSIKEEYYKIISENDIEYTEDKTIEALNEECIEKKDIVRKKSEKLIQNFQNDNKDFEDDLKKYGELLIKEFDNYIEKTNTEIIMDIIYRDYISKHDIENLFNEGVEKDSKLIKLIEDIEKEMNLGLGSYKIDYISSIKEKLTGDINLDKIFEIEAVNFIIKDKNNASEVVDGELTNLDLIVGAKDIPGYRKYYRPTNKSIAIGFEKINKPFIIDYDMIAQKRDSKVTLGAVEAEKLDEKPVEPIEPAKPEKPERPSKGGSSGSGRNVMILHSNGGLFSNKNNIDRLYRNDTIEEPKRKGYKLIGWSDKLSGNIDKTTKDLQMILDNLNSNEEYYAIWKQELLNKEDHYAYVKGYKDNTVKPENLITREEVSVIFYRLLNENYKNEIYKKENTFIDVKIDRWSNNMISTLSNGSILKGYRDGSFRPSNHITRSEVAAIASRFDNLSGGENLFTDIDNHWAKEYIVSASEKGWIKGYEDGSFKPNNYITRAEFITLVNGVLNRKIKKNNILPGIKEFKDLRENKWYYEDMVEAINGHEYERMEDKTEKWIKLIDKYFE